MDSRCGTNAEPRRRDIAIAAMPGHVSTHGRQAIVLVLALMTTVLSGCHNQDSVPANIRLDPPVEASDAEVRAFCGACHAVPDPKMFPRSQWYDEVRRGYEFYYHSLREDLHPPIQTAVVEYYRNRAEDQLRIEVVPSVATSIRFRTQSIAMKPNTALPAISFVGWLPFLSDRGRLRLCEMQRGELLLIEPSTAAQRTVKLPCPNPAAIHECDLDGNGIDDWLIADLGSFLPADHDRGLVVWIPDGVQSPNHEPQVILSGIGRVADVRAADFDGDGDQDIVVAEFGWHRTGGIHILWNDGIPHDSTLRSFRDERIDNRPGAIQVPVADLNGDGRPDFVTVISQEHEVVIAFLNLPDGFQKQILFDAGDPSWGSSGIELVDFDHDGDLDVLCTNGDTFDSFVLKPYHSVGWLENQDSFPWKRHSIGNMPGVHRALAADLDGDGDLDVAASALAPQKLLERGAIKELHAVVWYEQTSKNEFVCHALRSGTPVHPSMDVGDFDGDGDVDLAAGGFYEQATSDHPALLIFWNEGPVRP